MREIPLEKEATLYRGNGKWFQHRRNAYYAIAKSLVAARFPRWLDDLHTDLEETDAAGDRVGDVLAAAEHPPMRDWRARRERMFELLYDYNGTHFDPQRWQRLCRRLAKFLAFVDRRKKEIARG